MMDNSNTRFYDAEGDNMKDDISNEITGYQKQDFSSVK